MTVLQTTPTTHNTTGGYLQIINHYNKCNFHSFLKILKIMKFC